MSVRTALAILTYVDRNRPPQVRHRLKSALRSLDRSSFRGRVIVVDDGSTCERHLNYLDRLARSGRYEVIKRPANGGISRAKNTCLRALSERNIEIGFLAEDDILFYEGWDDAYISAMKTSGIHHFSWYVHTPTDAIVACNGGLVSASSGLLGLLLTFTRDVLSGVGGFKVLPHRYGYEHIQWTYRTMLAGLAPFPCDIADSHRYVERNTLPSSLKPADVRLGTEQNRASGYAIERVFEPFAE
jgi:glycosyltransferase involved in cell wall biosynthesis